MSSWSMLTSDVAVMSNWDHVALPCVQGVSEAQEELDKAEERKRDAELDIILTLRAMPGAGTGLTAELDQHARGGKIVTVSQKRFIAGNSLFGAAAEIDAALKLSEPEPEPEPNQGLIMETRSATEQAEAARFDRLAGFQCPLAGAQDELSAIAALDDAQELAVDGLKAAPFVVLDNFVGSELCAAMRAEVQRLDKQGHLKEGELGGGRTGANLTYYNSKVRPSGGAFFIRSSLVHPAIT